MKQIDVRAIVDSINNISYFDGALDAMAHKLRITNFEYSEIYRISQIFGLKETKKRIEAMNAKHLDTSGGTAEIVGSDADIHIHLTGIRDSFYIEAARLTFFVMDEQKIGFWDNPTADWEVVLDAIVHPDIEDQVSEASRCLALGRNAACVFHLNCIVEIGFLHIHNKIPNIKVDPRNKPTWKTWINAIAGYCNQTPKPPDHEKLEAINAVLAAIKAPWRDGPTHAVHMVRLDEDARIQYDGVKRVMQMIAEL